MIAWLISELSWGFSSNMRMRPQSYFRVSFFFYRDDHSGTCFHGSLLATPWCWWSGTRRGAGTAKNSVRGKRKAICPQSPPLPSIILTTKATVISTKSHLVRSLKLICLYFHILCLFLFSFRLHAPNQKHTHALSAEIPWSGGSIGDYEEKRRDSDGCEVCENERWRRVQPCRCEEGNEERVVAWVGFNHEAFFRPSCAYPSWAPSGTIRLFAGLSSL